MVGMGLLEWLIKVMISLEKRDTLATPRGFFKNRTYLMVTTIKASIVMQNSSSLRSDVKVDDFQTRFARFQLSDFQSFAPVKPQKIERLKKQSNYR